MSRTFRRKNKKPSFSLTHDYKLEGYYIDKFGCKRYYWKWVPYTGKELAEIINKNHKSDNHSGIHTAPSWYENMFFERKTRRKNKVKLRKLLYNNDYDDYSFDPHKRCSMYDWH